MALGQGTQDFSFFLSNFEMKRDLKSNDSMLNILEDNFVLCNVIFCSHVYFKNGPLRLAIDVIASEASKCFPAFM